MHKFLKKYLSYRSRAKYFEKKYLESNHLLKHFETQFAPGHFYSPYPDLKEVRKRKNEIFNRSKKSIPGIDIREKDQLNLLRKISKHINTFPYKHKEKADNLSYYLDHHAFAHTDATILFCILNEYRPKKIVEIGSGYSSALMLDYKKYTNNNISLTFIEPYPQLLRKLINKNHRYTNYNLIDKPLWKVDPRVFKKLSAGDILFIDSTHVSKAGSDVNTIFFDILPQLKKGVIIHIHDVFYPFEYPQSWIEETRAWNEDYLLRAFLYNNSEYRIMLFNHFLNVHHQELLHKLLPHTIHNDGGSLWIIKE